MTRNIRLLCRL